MIFAEDHARTLGLTRLCPDTNERMTENLAFYPRRGYIERERRVEDNFRRVFFSKEIVP